MNITSQRDTRLDILRGIGLLCIMLAHVDPPSILFQLRNFDVPLMVLVSGASFSLSQAQNDKYNHYLFIRFVRLVIPTWIFLTIFFGITFVASFLTCRAYPFSIQQVLSSFALMDGIGYVWIIRVFFLASIIAPIANIDFFRNRKQLLLFSCGLFYIAYEFTFCHLSLSEGSWFDFIFNELIFYAVPYGVILIIGMSMCKINVKNKFFIASFLLFIFIFIMEWFYVTTGRLLFSQIYKYPPRIYYLSYAVGMSFFISIFVELISTRSFFIGKFLGLIGKMTMWTYLWHIFVLYIIKWINFNSNFIVMFLVVFSVTFSIVVMQELTLKLILRKVDNDGTRKLLSMVLSG